MWKIRFTKKYLTLIGKSWKTHPEIFPKYQFSGLWHRLIFGKFIQYFFRNFNSRGISLTEFWKIHPSIFLIQKHNWSLGTRCFFQKILVIFFIKIIGPYSYFSRIYPLLMSRYFTKTESRKLTDGFSRTRSS